MQREYRVDAEAGVVYGLLGKPIRRINGRGYVEVFRAGGYEGLVHRMVWESVHGPIPDGMQINHMNGIKTDNRVSNLEIVTSQENTVHAYRTGLISRLGQSNGRALLTPDDVVAIRAQSTHLSRKEIARLHGVSVGAVRSILTRKTWSHIK
jgi:DNA-binding transcriptional regulator YiaG